MTEKIFEALQRAQAELAARGLDANAARLLMEHVTEKPGAALFADMREELAPAQAAAFQKGLAEMLEGRPVQHLIGHEEFYGYRFEVNRHVLIPRPETEELVHGALERAGRIFGKRQPIRMADIGTGSGAIAVSFKKEWPDALVAAVDISKEALAVARRNAAWNGADVEFLEGDLTEPLEGRTWDVVLSNPPYIAEPEASMMSRTVVDHEPHGALFAADNGLQFYKRLARELPGLMADKALIGVEIGHWQGPVVRDLFARAFPEAAVSVKRDINGKDRMIFCEIQ